MEAGGIICFNGEYLPAGEAAVPAADLGVLYGMGIFETVRVSRGRPGMMDRHLSRLFASAGELGLEVHFSREEIDRMARRTAAENRLEEGGLRITLTAGGEISRPCLFVTARKSPYRREQYRYGIRAGFSSVRRNKDSPLVRHKTLNYFENILARREARAAGWDEALFLNNSGGLAEGSVSNIFLVVRGKVITPHPESGLLPGITRGRVIEACAALQIPVEERTVSPGELFRAGECFVTNSLMGVMPVTSIGGAPVGNGRPGEITRLIAGSLQLL
ncbi:MAG: aminotransferase class IV [Peptococcaceae bacterium]|nr:aminotransferase class IV [Peptococcaceae bacterium]